MPISDWITARSACSRSSATAAALPGAEPSEVGRIHTSAWYGAVFKRTEIVTANVTSGSCDALAMRLRGADSTMN